jgi:hypothetical protein
VPDILGNDQSILPIVQAARLVISHEGASSALECLIGSCWNMSKYQQGADGIVTINYASLNI